ncbi:MAG: hypothetical protein ISS51_00650 [Dehalococcoidales bacterium]|nr:hypothetical protein [Dehalococcoidales bacterium]
MRQKKTKGFFICFTGMDGSGKTTLARELVVMLREKGIECKYIYARFSPFILKPFMLMGKWLFLRGKDFYKAYPEYSSTKRRAIQKHSLLSRAYRQIMLLDYSLQVFLKVRLPLFLGRNIICDRYLYDTVITDLAPDMGYAEDRIIALLTSMLRFFPKPDTTFLIDLREEIAYQRKDDIPSLEYLKERRNTYLNIGRKHNMVVLDGTRPIDELKGVLSQQVSYLYQKE